MAEVNGELALVAYVAGRLDSVFVFSVEGGAIARIHAVRNPDKLAWMAGHAH